MTVLTSKTLHLPDHRLSWLNAILGPALVALVVLLGSGIYLDQQSRVVNEERMRADVLADVSLLRAKLEGNINSNIQLVRGLVSVISTEPDMQQQRFSALVSNLFEEKSQLRSIAAAPGLVVAMTYPLEGNERAIGLDYRNNAAQWSAVMRARDTGKLVLAGPVDLVQGGRAFVGRFPVFTDTPSGTNFWGVVSAVVDVGRLYADSGLIDHAQTLDISITGKDATGGEGTRFFGNDLRGLRPVTASVSLPSGSWEIAAVPHGGWSVAQGNVWMVRALMVVVGLLILFPIVMIGRLVGERQQHVRELKLRKSELERLSRRLGLALDVSKVGVFEMDLATGVETWDDKTNELFGWPADNGPRDHSNWTAAVHPDDIKRVEGEYERLLAATGGFEADYRVLLPDGTLRHVRSIAALYREPGSPDRLVGVNWDVTADVSLNEELRRATQLTEARNTELELARVRIEHNSLHDSLTGLPNRRFLDEMLKRHAAGGFLESGTMALLHIDLDRFKQINDTLGHAAGDAMLVHASTVLRDNCEIADFVARIGGDEFVVLTTADQGDIYLATLAERIVKEMRQPVTYEGHECRFGVSIGIAADRGAPVDAKRLLINADIALYRAKARGRNRFEFFSEALQAEVVKTKRVADEILNGIERSEFVAWYQPQFDAKTLDVVGVEALARWQHPSGIKTPDAFLPIAEELNVVATLDRLILEQSLADMARWDGLGLHVPRVSVNVSLRRLNDEDLINGLRQLDIQPGRLSFELVESIYLDEGDAVVGWNIDRIKELGIDVEIDDFGTGYASIVSLQKLRPTRLKIDRQLVNPILVDPGQRQLLASIVDIGKSMGIEVVAEGVETMEHAVILRDLGCDILQGYAFSRPLSAAALEEFLRADSWRKAS